MPWEWYRQLTDDDLQAIFAYLRTVPPMSNEVTDNLPAVTLAGRVGVVRGSPGQCLSVVWRRQRRNLPNKGLRGAGVTGAHCVDISEQPRSRGFLH
jgi:hypothetical protein